MRSFPLEIVTPDGTAYEGEAESLLIRTDEGDVEILAGHADYVATISIGRTRIRVGGENRHAASSGGFLTVKGGRVTLAATTFEFAENIDVVRAEAAKERAETALAAAASDKDEQILTAKLRRALNRLRVSSYTRG